MTLAILYKLLAIVLAVALGWIAGRMRWLGDERKGEDPARTLSASAFYIFIPALLFRTTARIDFAALQWGTMFAFFVPMVSLLVGVYVWQRVAQRGPELPPAGPSVRALTASFGNTVQVGIPLAAALFGEVGLGIHVTIVSLHALVLLMIITMLVELDLAREHARSGGAPQRLASTLANTARNTLIHPVVLPVLAGILWNALSLPLPPVVDEVLQLLGTAVVPLCLVLIGLSLAYYGVGGRVRAAVTLTLIKLVVAPVLVLGVAHWGFGLQGLPLAVVVMMAAMPIGSNPLIFSQRYETLQAETTAAIVFSTLGFVLTAPMWLSMLAWLSPFAPGSG